MDLNYLIDNNQLYEFYIFDSNKEISTQIDEKTFYYFINYLYDRVFINYLLIIFFFTCSSTIFICNYGRKKKPHYTLIRDQEPIIVEGNIIEKV